MANAGVNLSFLENGIGGLYLLHAGYTFLSGQDTINGPTAKYILQFIYFVVMILNNGMMN